MVKDHLGSGSLLDQLKFRNRIIALIPAARSPRLYDSLPRGRAAVKRESTSCYKVLDMRKRPCILVLSASLRRRETSPMETALPTQSQTSGKSPSGPFRGFLPDAIRFWEPRRLVYNFVLAAVVMVWLVASWPHFRPAFTLQSGAGQWRSSPSGLPPDTSLLSAESSESRLFTVNHAVSSFRLPLSIFYFPVSVFGFHLHFSTRLPLNTAPPITSKFTFLIKFVF